MPQILRGGAGLSASYWYSLSIHLWEVWDPLVFPFLLMVPSTMAMWGSRGSKIHQGLRAGSACPCSSLPDNSVPLSSVVGLSALLPQSSFLTWNPGVLLRQCQLYQDPKPSLPCEDRLTSLGRAYRPVECGVYNLHVGFIDFLEQQLWMVRSHHQLPNSLLGLILYPS